MFLLGVERFDEGQILPVIWMEVTSGEISTELRAMIYHSTFSANAIQLSLRYGTLLFCIIFIVLFVVICCLNSKANQNSDPEVCIHVHLSNNAKSFEEKPSVSN